MPRSSSPHAGASVHHQHSPVALLLKCRTYERVRLQQGHQGRARGSSASTGRATVTGPPQLQPTRAQPHLEALDSGCLATEAQVPSEVLEQRLRQGRAQTLVSRKKSAHGFALLPCCPTTPCAQTDGLPTCMISARTAAAGPISAACPGAGTHATSNCRGAAHESWVATRRRRPRGGAHHTGRRCPGGLGRGAGTCGTRVRPVAQHSAAVVREARQGAAAHWLLVGPDAATARPRVAPAAPAAATQRCAAKAARPEVLASIAGGSCAARGSPSARTGGGACGLGFRRSITHETHSKGGCDGCERALGGSAPARHSRCCAGMGGNSGAPTASAHSTLGHRTRPPRRRPASRTRPAAPPALFTTTPFGARDGTTRPPWHPQPLKQPAR